MKSRKLPLVIIAGCLVLAGCVTTYEKGSREEAVSLAWKKFCMARYCEGYVGTIVDMTENTITVDINGHTRYLRYTVSGEPNNYVVDMWPTSYSSR
ncbi:MAG: hypothetical protein ABW088_12175 [Sedimenticola sp.]